MYMDEIIRKTEDLRMAASIMVLGMDEADNEAGVSCLAIITEGLDNIIELLEKQAGDRGDRIPPKAGYVSASSPQSSPNERVKQRKKRRKKK